MKKGDIIAVVYFLVLCAIVFFFPFTVVEGKISFAGFDFAGSCSGDLTGLVNFGKVVALIPYISGFFKVALLATLGELIKVRGKNGSWKMPFGELIAKFIVWGFYGMLFTIAFKIFGVGVGGISGGPIWPFSFENETMNHIFKGFSISLWINLIFCYPMMMSHEYFNHVIAHKRLVGGEEFFKTLNAHAWGSFLPKTIIFFWIPAHTVTFCLPANYQILMSAFLSLALGFILTISAKKK